MSANARRPNRSAAERRQQYLRSQAKATAHILRSVESLHHRGNAPSRPLDRFTYAVQAAVAAPSSSSVASSDILASISTQLGNLGTQLHHLQSQVSRLEAQQQHFTASTPHRLEELVDPATVERVRKAQEAPDIWFRCTHPDCKYTLLSSDKYRSQKKAQHLRTHATADFPAPADGVETTSSPAEVKPASRISGKTPHTDVKFVPLDRNVENAATKPATRIAGKTKLADGKFVPLARTTPLVPGEEASASSAPADLDSSVQTSSGSAPSTDVALIVHNLDHGSKVPCIFRRTRPLEQLFVQLCRAFSVGREKANFIISNRSLFLQGTETAESLGLEDGTVIQFSRDPYL